MEGKPPPLGKDFSLILYLAKRVPGVKDSRGQTLDVYEVSLESSAPGTLESFIQL